MNRKTIIGSLVILAVGIAIGLGVATFWSGAINKVFSALGADPLTVPDSVATTSDTFVAEADCVAVINPDSVEIATTPRIILPKPAHDDALTRQGRRIFNDRSEKVSEGGSGVIVDSEALQRRIQERANQDQVPWYYAEWDTTTQFYDLKVGIFSASPRPIIMPQLDYHNDIWYRMFMEERINRSLTKQRWKGRVEGALTTAAIFGIISAVR